MTLPLTNYEQELILYREIFYKRKKVLLYKEVEFKRNIIIREDNSKMCCWKTCLRAY